MNDLPSVKKESKIGTYVLVVSAIVGAVWAVVQMYSYFRQGEERIVATGTHSNFEVPIGFKKAIWDKERPLSKSLKENVPDKATIEKEPESARRLLTFLDVVEKREDESKAFLKELGNLKTFREIKIENSGKKEAENISLELEDSIGVYQVGDDSNAPTGTYNKSIPVGNLRPTLWVNVYVWSVDTHYSWRKAFVSFKNGSENVVFLQDIDLADFTWTWSDYVWYSILALVVIGASFGVGWLIGNKELRKKFAPDNQGLIEAKEEKEDDKT